MWGISETDAFLFDNCSNIGEMHSSKESIADAFEKKFMQLFDEDCLLSRMGMCNGRDLDCVGCLDKVTDFSPLECGMHSAGPNIACCSCPEFEYCYIKCYGNVLRRFAMLSREVQSELLERNKFIKSIVKARQQI